MKKSEIYRTLGRPIEAAEHEQKKAKDNEAGAFGKIGATVLELLVGAPTKGAIKSIEGIYDAHVGAIGAIGGAFDEDFKENLGKHIAFDATGWLSDAIGYDKVEDASFLDDGKVGNFVRDVEQGIGGMAPSVALSAIPYAGAVLGPVSMGMAAGGNNMESALQNDAGYYGAWLYGIGTGVVEGATEAIGGFALGKSSTLVSKMLSGTKLGKVASSGLGKVAETFISEAGEEVMSDLADPALKYATGVDKNIGENYKETFKGLPRTALLGGTIGSIMGGGSAAVAGVRNSSRGGFKASRADNSMEYISKVSKYYDKDISKHGKYDKAIDDALYDISRELTAMSKEQRTNYMSTMGLYKNAFNEDGSIKSDLRADINTGAVSSNLRAISATLKHKPLSADTELTDGASKAKSYVEKMLGEGANVVVTSDSAQNNAFYNVDEGIVYINNNAAFSGEEIAEFVATHEVAHITEGTRAYGEMALMLEEIAKDPKAPAALKAKIGDINARKKQIRDAYAGQMQGMNITQREFLVDTELNADLVGILLGDEYFIEKLAQRDASLVEKIFNKLKALAKRDTSSTTSGPPSPRGEGYKKSASVDRESARYLSKLVNKFGRAINKSQGGVRISQIGREDEEKGAEVDGKRYSIGKIVGVSGTEYGIGVHLDSELLTNLTEDERVEMVKEYIKELGGSVFTAYDNNGNAVEVHIAKANQKFKNKSGKKPFVNKDMSSYLNNQTKQEAIVLIDELIQTSNFEGTEPAHHPHDWLDNNGQNNWDVWTTFLQDKENTIWKASLRIANSINGEKFLYDIYPIKKVEQSGTSDTSTTTNRISQNSQNVNTFDKKIDDERKSISKSADVTQSKQFIRFFGDWQNNPESASKVVNADGTPRVVYHGSNQEFSIFDLQMSGKNFGEASQGFFFFTNKKSAYPNSASDYAENASKKEGKPTIYECYLSIKKPLRLDSKGYYDTISYFDSNYDKIYEQYFWSDCDGVIIENSDKSADDGVLYLVDDSTQVKSATDNIGTFDGDNPDIRYSKSKGERFTVGRETEMRLAEELVKGYEEGTLSSEDALRKLNALGYKTGINTDNALERLEELIPEIREYATSERAAYRESNRKDTSSTTSGPPSPQVEGYEGAMTEEDANRQAQDSLDYWVKNGDQFYGSVKYLKNGKVKVKLAQTANEVRLAKFINNNIMGKAYTNQDVKSIIDKVLTNSNIWGAENPQSSSFASGNPGKSGSYMAKLKGEDLSAVKKQLWAALNTAPEGERIGPALDIADYIVKHGILTEIVEVTEDVYYAQNIIDTLEPYKRKIDISHIKSDIEAKFDTDRTPFGLWAQKKSDTSRGFTADEVGQALEEVGIVLNGDRGNLINEADIFVAMHELYTMAQSIIKNAAPAKNDIVGAYDAKEIHELKQKIASEIMSSYEQYGKETTFSKMEKKYRGEISSLKKRVKDVHEENRLKNAVLYEAQKIKDSKAGKYHNATQVQDDSLKALKALLGKIKYRSDLNRSSVRKIINELAKWYTEDNPVLQSFAVDKQTSESRGLYSPHIKALIDLFLIEDAEFAKDKIVSNFGSFSEKEIANYNNSDKISVAENDEQIKTFIDDSLDGKNNGKKLIVGKLSEDLVDKIKKSTEVDLQGFNFELRADALMHMKKHHGNAEKEANRGQVPVDTNAVLNAIEVVTSFDTVEKGKNDNSLVFTKNINGVYHVVTYYAYGNKSIYPHTLYITKKDGLAQTNNANENNSYLARNVQDDLSTAINNSITENDEIVKAAEEKRAQKAQKPLDTTELGALNQILHHMNFVFESYGKIWRGGRWVDAPEIAKEQIAVLQEARANETVVGKLLKQGYFNFFMDPELVCARLDGADKNGYFTTLLEDLRQADIKQRHDEMLALERYDAFEKKHKKYITALMSEKNTVKVGNVIDPHAEGGATAEILEIPRYAAIDLYMVSKTRGALETFEKTGWVLRLDSNKKDFEKQNATITAAQIKGIEKQFTKEDLELIEIMEEQYNVNLRRLKYETDMIRLGMSNVFDGYYYPINRIGANNLDSNDFFFDLERVSNSSFNNSRVKGAKQAIIVSNVLTKFKKHVNGVTRYANLSIPIENMTKLLNIDVGNNANMPQSITMLLRKTKDGLDAEDYIKTLIKDVQQVNIQTDAATKVVSYLRGAYAKSTLGFNPKVLFTQASSYIAGFGELRASSLAYGVAHIAKLKGLDGELDKYCPWAAVRHYEKGATRAMTVTDKISKAGDFFTMGIEFMDRQIVKLEFLACQHEAKVRYHLEIGTEENKIKAGELLMELGLKTQQNQLTTEKSAAMRSQSEFAKTLTMFKADSMKQISRFLQTINAMSILKKKMQAARNVGDTSKYSTLEAEYKRAQKSFCKYSAVIIVSSVYMVMLARLFNKLYGREEEDENKVLGFFEDLFGNICGMIPIISELYAFFVDGYEVDSFLYSTLNNTMDAVKGTAEVVGGLVSGKNVSQEEINTSIRKLVYSIGALAGLPAKNMYKNTKAVIDLVSPSTGDKIDAWFKAPSEKSLEENIKASIEKGNDKAVSSSLELLYDKYDLKLEDAVLRREYDRLMRLEMAKAEDDSAKYSPLEAKIPSNLTVDGEEVELLKKDINAFKNAFLVAEKSQASVVKTAPYKKLKDEERAYALRKISQFYYEETKYFYTGEKSNFTYYAKVVGIEDLALILAYAKNLKGDARQSRREKIEAYIKGLGLNAVKTSLALRCLGYSDKDNDELVKGYVGRASVLSKEERAEMLKILE